MKLTVLLLLLSALMSDALTSAFALGIRDIAQDQPTARAETWTRFQDLWKRRGGGGGGGRGGGGSGGHSSGGSGSSSSGGSSSGGRGGGSSSSGGHSNGGKTSSSSSSGGSTKSGSGPTRSYGGGSYYGGGATVPYRAGGRSPSGISPYLIGAGLGLAFWPGIWYHPVYFYPYPHTYTFHNDSSGQNETKPVVCGCDSTEECGCDGNTNSTYMGDLVGNGTYAAMNKSLVNVAEYNGSNTILINGSLPNGTTASGGTSNAAGGFSSFLQATGWWPVVATVFALVFAL